MATDVYGRKYSLRIGSLSKLAPTGSITGLFDFSEISDVVTGGVLKSNSEQEGYRDYVTIPPEENVIEISDLHIETSVALGANAKSNVSGASISLKIYNLSKDTQRRIKAEDSVILRAGYEQDEELALIFAAQVITVNTRKMGVDTVTTINCGDSFTPRKNLRVSKTYPKGTTKRSIIQDLLSQAANYGVPTGQFYVPTTAAESNQIAVNASLVSSIKYNLAKEPATTRVNSTVTAGYTVFGLLFEELARVCNDIDYRSYLLQGALYVEPIEYRIKQSTVAVTGDTLIGSIREEDGGATNLTGDTLKQSGITMRVPLNGKITTTSLISVSSIEEEELSGSYAVTSLKHFLNYEKGDWATQISCKRVS